MSFAVGFVTVAFSAVQLGLAPACYTLFAQCLVNKELGNNIGLLRHKSVIGRDWFYFAHLTYLKLTRIHIRSYPVGIVGLEMREWLHC